MLTSALTTMMMESVIRQDADYNADGVRQRRQRQQQESADKRLQTLELSPCPRLMESCPDMALLNATATATSKYMSSSTALYISTSVTINESKELLRQYPSHSCIRYPTPSTSFSSTVPCWQPVLTGFDSIVFWFDQFD